MIPLTTMTATKPTKSFWTASLYAALFTAIAGIVQSFAVPRDLAWLFAVGALLTGVAPVLGFQVAKGKAGSSWLSLLGGLLGFIPAVIPLVGVLFAPILWAILVGLMTKGQSFGRLLLWSVIGLALGLVVTSVIAFAFGQDPTRWVGPAWVLALAAWGGTVGAAMARYDHSDEA